MWDTARHIDMAEACFFGIFLFTDGSQSDHARSVITVSLQTLSASRAAAAHQARSFLIAPAEARAAAAAADIHKRVAAGAQSLGPDPTVRRQVHRLFQQHGRLPRTHDAFPHHCARAGYVTTAHMKTTLLRSLPVGQWDLRADYLITAHISL